MTRWILRHQLLVIAVWIIIAGIGISSSARATAALSQQFTPPAGYEGIDTNRAIQRQYGNGGSAAPLVPVIALPAHMTVYSPGIREQLRQAMQALQRALPSARIASFATDGDRGFVSADGRTTFALVYLPSSVNVPAAQSVHTIQQVLAAHAVAGAQLWVTGRDALASWSNGGGSSGVLAETLFGGLGALFILIMVFGSFLAIVPLLMATVAIPTTFLLVWGLTTITQVSFIVEFLISLIGLGVSIDYSLLIVTRWREERARGLQNREAVVRAMGTAGRAVLFSGTTVGISLLALVVLPVPFLRSVGYGGLLIPLVTVVVASTLLPVVLASVGPLLDHPRHQHSDRPSRLWTAWARGVIRHRWVAAGSTILVLGSLLLPLSGLNLGTASPDALTSSGSADTGLQVLEQSGIGAGVLDPIEVLATVQAAPALLTQLSAAQGVRAAFLFHSPNWQHGGTALIDVLPAMESTSTAGRAVLDQVRQIAHAGSVQAHVGGQAADNADFVAAVYGSFPLMVGLIALVTYLLLVRAFRSLLLPLKALLLNVISVGAAWGVMTLIWQDGHGSGQIWGIAATGSLTAWIPLMVFAFLFGLSMDYEVFILARMREEYDRTGSTDAAVIGGIGQTGRLVTCAALILVLAFVAMGAIPMTDTKVMATGLAAGILLDATLVRMLLVPSLVSLLGQWNWWLPALPARLLRVQPSPLEARSGDLDSALPASAAR